MFKLMQKLLSLVPGIKRSLYLTALLKVFETCFIGAPYGILIVTLRDILTDTLTPQAIGYYTVSLGVCFLAQGVLNYLGIKVAYPIGTDICEQLRLDIGNHLKALPMSYFSKATSGSINSLVSGELMMISLIPRMAFPQFISAMVLPIILAPFLFSIDWRLAIISLVVVPISVPLLQQCRNILNRGLRKRSASLVDVSSKIIEYIQGMEVVKGFNQTGERFESFQQALNRFKEDNLQLAFKATPVMMAFNAVLDLGFVLILLCGAYLFLGGEVNLLTFLVFLILGLRMFEPIKALGAVYEIVQTVEVTLERVEKLLRAPVLPQPDTDVTPDGAAVEFRHVRFAYGETPVLRDVSFSVPEKSLTAFVGPSGAGKTTIVRLIARFWDVASGQILLGGKEVRAMRTETLLSSLSMIFQDVYLFKDTIFANIAYGLPNATREQVEAAAKAAQCHDFIAALPLGYETMVGEGGATLSGGEKQRISIARAILKDAPIILLDEATASIDPENEFLIQQAIGALARSKTLLVIAHRLSTITNANQIIVLDGHGGIEDRGTHEELLSRGGTYRSLWERQQSATGWELLQ